MVIILWSQKVSRTVGTKVTQKIASFPPLRIYWGLVEFPGPTSHLVDEETKIWVGESVGFAE